MRILDGKKLSDIILKKIKKEIKSRRLKLKLAVILVGNGQISRIFIHGIEKDSQITGVNFKLYKFPAEISGQRLKKEVEKVDPNKNYKIYVEDPVDEFTIIRRRNVDISEEDFNNIVNDQYIALGTSNLKVVKA